MEEKAILEKLDRILEILGEGRGRSTADLRRQAEADVIRLMAMNAEKDQYIKELVLLCLDNGIISRGMACTYLGCAREDLDDILRVVEDDDG